MMIILRLLATYASSMRGGADDYFMATCYLCQFGAVVRWSV
jgi:hypothetical protein